MAASNSQESNGQSETTTTSEQVEVKKEEKVVESEKKDAEIDTLKTKLAILLGMLPSNCAYFTFRGGNMKCEKCDKGYDFDDKG